MSLLPENVYNLLWEERPRYGTVVDDPACVNFLNTVAWRANGGHGGGPWGLTGKDFGVGHAPRYDGRECSHDTLLNRDTMLIYDVLWSAGAESRPVRGEGVPHTQSNRPWVAPIEPRDPAPPVQLVTKLGASSFSLVDLYQYDRPRADETLAWYREVLGARFLRVMWRKGTGAPGDYWLNEPFRSCVRSDLASLPVSLMAETMQYAKEQGFTIAHCVFADNLDMSRLHEDRFREGFVEAVLRVPGAHEYFEVFNEPYMYGGGHGGTIEMLQHHARQLRAALGPDVLISLGTPQAHMAISDLENQVRDSYGTCPEANLITVHWERSEHQAPALGPWAPKRRSNGEPRGPWASAGGDVSDPQVLAEDLLRSNRAGYEWYVYHSDPGIRPRAANVWDVPNATAIAAALREAAGEGARPVMPPTPVYRDRLLPDQSLTEGQELISEDGRFALAYQGDGNLVLYYEGQVLWNTGTHGDGAGRLLMQMDGNLVMYAADGSAVWSTGTHGNDGAWLLMQNDGNAVVYSSAGLALWATGTAQ